MVILSGMKESSARTGAILTLVGYLAIGGFLYILYKGDAKFTTFLALPVVALLGKISWVIGFSN